MGQNLGEAIAPIHRQDRRQGIEFEGAASQRIAGGGQGKDRSWFSQGSEYGNGFTPGGGGQFAVESRECRPLADRQGQIGGVIGAELMNSGQGQNRMVIARPQMPERQLVETFHRPGQKTFAHASNSKLR
jgi:hypothetical protein